MKFWPLLWANYRRRKARSLFTFLSIVVAFVLFAFLAAVGVAFRAGADVAEVDRLLTTHKVSIIQPLPLAYLAKIAAVPGVEAATYASWFGGVYQDASKGFQGVFQAPVDPEAYLRLYPEFVLSDEARQAWIADREGAIVGRKTAERYGWKIGDRIPIQATIYPKKDGSKIWEFNLRGIYDGRDKSTDTTQFLFRYDYFDEARLWGQGIVGWYVVRISDPGQAAEIASRIDAQFENSSAETKTATEKAFAQGWADQIGNVGAILRWILAAVFVTLLLISGNSMAQSVRERIPELAVLKTLGFSRGAVLGLVLAESLVLTALAGGLGLALGAGLVGRGDPTNGLLPAFYFPRPDVVLGILLVVVLGVATGLLPAVRAMRLEIVDALRRG